MQLVSFYKFYILFRQYMATWEWRKNNDIDNILNLEVSSIHPFMIKFVVLLCFKNIFFCFY